MAPEMGAISRTAIPRRQRKRSTTQRFGVQKLASVSVATFSSKLSVARVECAAHQTTYFASLKSLNHHIRKPPPSLGNHDKDCRVHAPDQPSLASAARGAGRQASAEQQNQEAKNVNKLVYKARSDVTFRFMLFARGILQKVMKMGGATATSFLQRLTCDAARQSSAAKRSSRCPSTSLHITNKHNSGNHCAHMCCRFLLN